MTRWRRRGDPRDHRRQVRTDVAFVRPDDAEARSSCKGNGALVARPVALEFLAPERRVWPTSRRRFVAGALMPEAAVHEDEHPKARHEDVPLDSGRDRGMETVAETSCAEPSAQGHFRSSVPIRSRRETSRMRRFLPPHARSTTDGPSLAPPQAGQRSEQAPICHRLLRHTGE